MLFFYFQTTCTTYVQTLGGTRDSMWKHQYLTQYINYIYHIIIVLICTLYESLNYTFF